MDMPCRTIANINIACQLQKLCPQVPIYLNILIILYSIFTDIKWG